MTEYVVLYHRGCNDGIAAAWATREVLKDTAIYLPYQYGERLPDAVAGSHLILVDLSLTVEQLSAIWPSQVKSVMIIDHHKTAIEALANVESVTTYADYLERIQRGEGSIWKSFDMDYAGAVLTWAWFNNIDISKRVTQEWMEQMPEVLVYIQDYDLWRHRYPESKAVNAWLINGGLLMDRVGEMIADNGEINSDVLTIGEAMLKYDENIAKGVIKAYLEEYPYGKGKIALVNAPHHLRNLIGDMLAEKYLFVVCYTRRKHKTIFSMRSTQFDVSTIAERHGGGGHAAAAAFSVPNGPNQSLLSLMVKPTFMARLRMALMILFPKKVK
ncbi:hypothetical protein D3C80_1049880 [compost metagenome]